MGKKERQSEIVKIINESDIETQEELTLALNNNGYRTTQATISRDIRELNLIKSASSDGKQKYSYNNEEVKALFDEKFKRILSEGFISMDVAENILVIKTVSGMAMAVAAAIDSMDMNEMVGCIAGDDTIMAAIRTKEDVPKVMNYIGEIVKGR